MKGWSYILDRRGREDNTRYMRDENKIWSTGVKVSLVVFLLCFAYAFVRYNIVRSVPLEEVPLYISNKAMAFSATILIGLSFLLGPLARFFPGVFVKHLQLRKSVGLFGFGLASVHAIASLILFDPSYYPRFFLESGKLTWIGESTMLFGILAFVIFGVVSISSLPDVAARMGADKWKTIQRLGYLAYILVLLHVALMGYGGWFRASSWEYGMASITLVASAFIVFVLLLRIVVQIFPSRTK